MCGIYGVQTATGEKLSLYESTVITHTLAREMESRGRDSFGSITLPDGRLYKGLGRVAEAGVKLLKAASESTCFLAHTRAATVGEVSIKNCHPFEVGNVLGVHNGSIYNYKDLNDKYGRQAEVDSEHLFYNLNEGLDLNEIEGYGVFFWTLKDEKYSNIYLAKTYTGCLTVAKLYRGDSKEEGNNSIATIWASESAAIRKATSILGLSYVEIIIDPAMVYYLNGGEVYKTDKPFRIKPVAWANSNSNNNNGYNHHGYSRSDYESLQAEDMDGGWLGHNNIGLVLDVEDVDTDDDILVTPSSNVLMRGLLALIETRNLSKRERKVTKRRLAYFRNKNKKHIKEPSIDLIHKGVGFKRHYVVTAADSNGSATAKFHCPTCECDFDKHLWGWCTDDYHSKCKAKIGQGCDITFVPICSDCGHYLIEGVHVVNTEYDIVHCTVCSDYCVPESQIISRFREDKDKDSEGEEADKDPDSPTENSSVAPKLHLVPSTPADETHNTPDDMELLISE